MDFSRGALISVWSFSPRSGFEVFRSLEPMWFWTRDVAGKLPTTL